MRTIALVVALIAACSGDGPADPHEEVPCESDWGTVDVKACERACTIDTGNEIHPCAAHPFGMCAHYVEVDGVGGCCDYDNASGPDVVRWLECD